MMYEMSLDMDLLSYLRLNKTTEKTPFVENWDYPFKNQHRGVFSIETMSYSYLSIFIYHHSEWLISVPTGRFDVDHEGVITGCDGFSLRSSIAEPQGVAQAPLQSTYMQGSF